MSWNSIIGQKKVKEYFRRVFAEGVLANAYCFYGVEGVGKFATALEIIKTASCLKPKLIDGYRESCGECQNCIDILNLKFPNVEYIFSLPSGKVSEKEDSSIVESLSDALIEEINLKLKEKIANPYAKFSIEGASQIKVAQIRELRKALALSNSLPGRKFVVFFNAEEMRIESQNAFLKTLEEPRSDITFFLLTTKREGLLPTILSRCQQIFFPPLSDQEIAFVLKQENKLSEDEIKIISRFANGSLTRAYELVGANLKDLRNSLIDLLRISLKKELPGKQLVDKINELTSGMDKKMAQTCLHLLGNWLRDAVVVASNGSDSLVVNIDDLETLERFANKFVNENINQAFEVIENANYMIFSNVQIPNVFLNLFLEIRKLLIKIS
ncbi:MAG: DNA polymerase III delta prime subunit [Candidatus Kapaibacterium sp.]|nr:MAG: DNA polymerase III delta prime subunit [Candidatus Kapabacteria bacterium]